MNVNLIILLLAIVVCLTWFHTVVPKLIFLVPLLNVIPGASTMKFLTAFSFIMVAVMFSIIKRDRHSVFAAMLCYALLITHSGWLLVPVDFLFLFSEQDIVVYTSTPGKPSPITALSFIFIAIFGISWSYSSPKFLQCVPITGVGLISLVAFTGYILGIPEFYFNMNGDGSGMAIHTAGLFFLCVIEMSRIVSRGESNHGNHINPLHLRG